VDLHQQAGIAVREVLSTSSTHDHDGCSAAMHNFIVTPSRHVLVLRVAARGNETVKYRRVPPFRDLPRKYPVEHLAESLAEGIVVGHNDMPEFLFEPDDIEALLAYISGLARQPQ
jgi:hypothetical protein